MPPVISLPFCIACMATEQLFNIHEPFKDSSSETLSHLLKECFDFEVIAESLQYLCMKCSHRLIDAQNFQDELRSTLEVLLETSDKDNIENESESYKDDISSDDEKFDINDLKPLKELVVVAADKKTKTKCKTEPKNSKKLKHSTKQTHPDQYKCDKTDKLFVRQGRINRHQRRLDSQIIKKKQGIDLPQPMPHLFGARYEQKSAAGQPKKKQYRESLPYKLEPNQTVCKMCDAEFTLPRMLQIHMHEHYPLHVCAECGKGFATKASLQRHKSVHSTGPFSCQHCKKEFDRLNSLRSHVWLRHSGTSLLNPCDKCEMRFATEVQRLDHKAEVHGESYKLYPCAQCGRVFKRYVHMLSHIQSRHGPASNRTCKFCKKKFSEVSFLGRHVRNVHKIALFSYKEHSCYNADQISSSNDNY